MDIILKTWRKLYLQKEESNFKAANFICVYSYMLYVFVYIYIIYNRFIKQRTSSLHFILNYYRIFCYVVFFFIIFYFIQQKKKIRFVRRCYIPFKIHIYRVTHIYSISKYISLFWNNRWRNKMLCFWAFSIQQQQTYHHSVSQFVQQYKPYDKNHRKKNI